MTIEALKAKIEHLEEELDNERAFKHSKGEVETETVGVQAQAVKFKIIIQVPLYI